MPDPATPIDIGGLLTIDVASELRKLSQAQLQGPWQIPAELVRRALKHGAKEVEVRTARQTVTVVDDSAGLGGEPLQWAAILMDPTGPNERRHAALTALEASGEFALLAIAGLNPRSMRVVSVAGSCRWTLEFEAGKTPWVHSEAGISGQSTQIEVRSPGFERRKICDWLKSVCRFSPANIVVDGRAIEPGFGQVFAEVALQPPLQGRLAIPTDGDAAHAWLLEYGLVTGHVSVPDAPSFEAAIEFGATGEELNAARLRDALQPHVPSLVGQAVGLLIELGHRAHTQPERLRARLSRLILQSARKRIRYSELASVPVFLAVDHRGKRCFSLQTLRDAARQDPSGSRVLPALYPSQRVDRFAIGNTPVLIADEVERSRLAELTQLRFRPPDPHDSAGSLGASFRRAADAVGRFVLTVVERIRHPWHGATLEDSELTAPEHALVLAMRRHLENAPTSPLRDVGYCRGGGPVRRLRTDPPKLLLPRENPDVMLCVRAFATDRGWLYPATLMLMGGRDLPPATFRASWLRREPARPRSGS